MKEITGGVFEGIEYGCMIDHNFFSDYQKKSNNGVLFGYCGLAFIQNQDIPAILWFDERENFVQGEIIFKPGRIIILEDGSRACILNACTKEETKSLGCWGQLLRVYNYNTRTVSDITYDYEITTECDTEWGNYQ